MKRHKPHEESTEDLARGFVREKAEKAARELIHEAAQKAARDVEARLRFLDPDSHATEAKKSSPDTTRCGRISPLPREEFQGVLSLFHHHWKQAQSALREERFPEAIDYLHRCLSLPHPLNDHLRSELKKMLDLALAARAAQGK